ncbi:Sugar phosphate permease [Plantibacter flavus]|uniref:Sugar phosphate permease n=2 Tax=Plantibacter flavus TaxID=150123 RepID=A0A3N2C6L1_9MICO|nr:sugar phosphate permease [Plantibacter flavus]SMG45996.1 Sugar phosphate permease [Plantibacter flavus]
MTGSTPAPMAPATARGARPPMPNAGRAWTVLGLGVAAQTAGTLFVSTPAFLIPLLHAERGMSLAEAGVLAAAPTLGMVLTLIAWGWLADRVGERIVIAGGLALTALAAGGAIAADGLIPSLGYGPLGILLLLGGAASASTNSASGRIVVGWFPKDRRGLAMGIRQMSQPLGVTAAAVTVPSVAAASGISAALVISLVATGVLAVACTIGLRNPPRTVVPKPVPTETTPNPVAGRPRNPYRGDGFLWRIHAVSILLVVPQFTLTTFALVWLVTDQGWNALAAGVLVGVAQFVGAIGRIGVGVLSDRVGSRVRPLRWVAVSAVVVMLFLAGVGLLQWPVAVAVALVVASAVTVADNGLAFTSVAEMAGPAWAGRALGAQNTGQFIAASVVGPAVGALIGLVGYPLAFLAVAVLPALAIPIIPSEAAEHDHL